MAQFPFGGLRWPMPILVDSCGGGGQRPIVVARCCWPAAAKAWRGRCQKYIEWMISATRALLLLFLIVVYGRLGCVQVDPRRNDDDPTGIWLICCSAARQAMGLSKSGNGSKNCLSRWGKLRQPGRSREKQFASGIPYSLSSDSLILSVSLYWFKKKIFFTSTFSQVYYWF